MFTGLVEATGEILSVLSAGSGKRIRLRPGFGTDDAVMGESVAINGVCLTVVDIKPGDLSFDVSPETLRATNLGELGMGRRVNLERAMRMSDRFGGHLVSGHVDGVGTVLSVEPSGEFTTYRISAPTGILEVSVKKGSIAVDGISLTIVDLDETSFSVAIIPHTARETTIGAMKSGCRVNLESDMIGKYVARLLAPRRHDRNNALLGLLKEEGFVK